MIDADGRISIHGLKVEGRIGVTEEERAATQTLLIDIDIHADLRAAAGSDDVSDTIDYGSVVDEVTELVATSSYRLLERLGAEITEHICRDPRVARVTVVVGKQSPPVQGVIDEISVGVTRTNGELGR
ncbi:MAG: 7,8-dihydroneopterin aldolase/epimerase/oxygenase [Actinomycetota bacterium]|nr:7,8-dihydroneopterin aldolase/epimerase/oxygenase [Actinomycetota bacterium]